VIHQGHVHATVGDGFTQRLAIAVGSRELYDFLDNNPFIEAHPVEHVNDPFVVSQNENLVAVNSAIEIDLTGFEVGDSIHFSRVTGAEGLKPTITDRDFTVATIAAPSVAAASDEDDAGDNDAG